MMNTPTVSKCVLADPTSLLDIIRCPVDKSALVPGTRDDQGQCFLKCTACSRVFPQRDQILNLIPDYPDGFHTPMRHEWLEHQILFENYLRAYSTEIAAKDVAAADEVMKLLPTPEGKILDIGGAAGRLESTVRR